MLYRQKVYSLSVSPFVIAFYFEHFSKSTFIVEYYSAQYSLPPTLRNKNVEDQIKFDLDITTYCCSNKALSFIISSHLISVLTYKKTSKGWNLVPSFSSSDFGFWLTAESVYIISFHVCKKWILRVFRWSFSKPTL